MLAQARRILSTHPGLFFFNFLEIALIVWWLAEGSLSVGGWIVDNECINPEWDDTIWAGFDDAVKAAELAYGYLIEIRESIQYSRGRYWMTDRQQRTLATYETIFGKAIYSTQDRVQGYRSINAQAFRRFEKILESVVRISRLNDDPFFAAQHYHIYCDAGIFQPWSIDAQGQTWYLDKRPLADGGGGVMPGASATCENNNMGFSWAAPPGTHYQSVYCPDWVRRWNSFGALSTLRDSRGVATANNMEISPTPHLSQIAMSFMPTNVLRSLAHSKGILGEGNNFVDVDCKAVGGANYRELYRYGWVCMTWLAQRLPTHAAINADSFAYLITALYLDYADWRDGFGRPVDE